MELWLEDGLTQGGRRSMSDAVAAGLVKEQRRLLVGVRCSGGRGERRIDQGRGMSRRRRKGKLFNGELLFKPHEVVAEGGGNGGWEWRQKRWTKPWA
jgi:hypothetical protein